MARVGLLAASACGVLGCGPLAAPVPEGIDPPTAYSGQAQQLVIRGRDFLPGVRVDYGDSRRSQVDAGFAAFLESIPLEEVTWVSTRELRAKLPWETPAGAYSLEVRGPNGQGFLDAALIVLRLPIERIAFASAPQSVPAGGCSGPVVLEAQGGDGLPVPLSGPLSISLESVPAGALSLFADPGCRTQADAAVVPAGSASASVFFSSPAPVSASLRATAPTGAVEQQEQVVPVLGHFLWDPIDSPQLTGQPFGVRARAFDGWGAPMALDGLVPLSSTGLPLVCLSGCSGSDALFQGGEFRGRIGFRSAGQEVSLMLRRGPVQSASPVFDVVPPMGTPPLAAFTRSRGVVRVGEEVAFDATLSWDLETSPAALEVSWDFEGTAPEPAPWTSWSAARTASHRFGSPGLRRVRLAVRDSNGNAGYARGDVLVIGASDELCVVTDKTARDDGAQSCADPFLSLPEAIRISNATAGKHTITFAGPMVAMVNRVLTVTSDVDVVAPSGVEIDGVQWGIASGLAFLSSITFDGGGAATAFGVGAAGNLWLSDDRVVGYGQSSSISGGALIEGTRFEGCATACLAVELGAGEVRVLGSSFDAPGAKAVEIHDCSGPPRELVGNLFLGLRAGLHVTPGCGSGPVVAVNNTFDGTVIGAVYDAGKGHVLVNNIFTHCTNAAVRGCGVVPFARLSHSLLFGDPDDGCTGSNEGDVVADPLFLDPLSQDYRVAVASPARDSAAELGFDLTPGAPGGFLGLGPDRGGRETW